MSDQRAGIDWHKARNVLIIRDDRLGDMALYLVVIQNLARRLPGRRIDVLCSQANAALLADDPAVDERIVISGGRLSEGARSHLAAHPPDVVIYYQNYANFDNLATSLRVINPNAVLCSMVKYAEEARGFTTAFVHHGGGSMYERNVGYAAWLLGIKKSRVRRPELPVDARVLTAVREKLQSAFSSDFPLVHVNLSGGDYKSYLRYLRRSVSVANYRRIVAGIKRRRSATNFVLTAAPRDAAIAERIARQLGDTVYFYRNTSIAELVSVMKLASLVITPETAVSHMASVLNKPLVTLFFAQRQKRDWRPFSDRYRCVIPGLLPLVWTINGRKVADAAVELLQAHDSPPAT